MTITKGFWHTRDNRKAEVVDVRHGIALGWLNSCPHDWISSSGHYSPHNNTEFDLIEPYIDKPEWDWSATLPWLNYLALDATGIWYLYQDKPLFSTNYYERSSGIVVAVPKAYAPKWQGKPEDSLISRPGI